MRNFNYAEERTGRKETYAYPSDARTGTADPGNRKRRSLSFGAEKALDAAVTAVEIAAAPGFDGSQEELERLLMDGLASKEVSEQEFWGSVDDETNAMIATYKPGSRE